MYVKRNAIYLVIALAITACVGLFFLNRLKIQYAEYNSKHKLLQAEYAHSDEIAKTLPEVQFMYDSLKSEWFNAPKKILALPEPQLTVSYMIWLSDHYNLNLPFDFRIDAIQQQDLISHFAFTISGHGSYKDIYTLVFYMTQNPILYKFEKLNLRRDDEARIEYQIQLKGFFLQQELFPGAMFNFAQQQAMHGNEKFHDVFYTTYQPPADKIFEDAGAIEKSEVKEIEPNFDLIDPTQASLLAMTSSTIYVLDEHGVMKRLSPGAQVDGGKLISIDQENSEAKFQLYGGRRVTMGLGYTKQL